MDRMLREALEEVRVAAAQAREVAAAAHQAGGSAGEALRRARELTRLEDLGRSVVLECLEGGHVELALEAVRGMAAAVEDEAERAGQALLLARQAQAVAR